LYKPAGNHLHREAHADGARANPLGFFANRNAKIGRGTRRMQGFLRDCTTLGRLAKIDATACTSAPFTDVKAGAYYAPYAAWAKDGVYALAFAGLLNGVGENNYAPTKTAAGAEVATLLMRFSQEYIK
jgi:hypothetical protein